MNLKYYLRGLGLGMIVTAVILGLTLGSPQKMSDDEIKARAKELGMIENTVLSEYGSTKETEQENEADLDSEPAQTSADTDPEITSEEAQVPPAEDITEAEAKEQALPQTEETADAPEEAKTDAVQPESQAVPQADGDEVSFAVQKGDDSHTVSKKLEEAGMIASAAEFDQYLVKNGFDKKIVTGSYSIPIGADFDTIVNIIIRR